MEHLSLKQRELVQVGKGTVMGQFMRQYWVPALKSDELKPGGDPLRLILFGEKLVAFRDAKGDIGIMDHRCPHRGVSLFLGRVEEDGLRCIYHGWKFAANGKCTEQASLPEHQRFEDRVKTISYPSIEKAGVIWVYMGEKETPPPLPELEIFQYPEDEIDVIFLQRRSNWLPSLEGEIDTGHFNFLHVGALDPDNIPEGHALEHTARGTPVFKAKNTVMGTAYVAESAIDGDQKYCRYAHFMFPYWTFIPQGEIDHNILARAWVPMDDDHTMLVFFRWARSPAKPLHAPLKDGKPLAGATLTSNIKYLPNSTDWYGRWRPEGSEANDWLMDREAQRRNAPYSGITGIHEQDQAMTESMGSIADHDFEQLAPTDVMIARTRRRLLEAAKEYQNSNEDSPGVNQPELYRQERSGYYIVEESANWEQAYAEQLERIRQGGAATTV